MVLRALVPLALAWTVLAHAAPACGQPMPAASAPQSDVRSWLLRIHDAAGRRNFQGTFVVSGGGYVASARISHFCEGPNQYERIESLDGKQRKVYRYNEVVHTVWPASHIAMIEQRGMLSSFPAVTFRTQAIPASLRVNPRDCPPGSTRMSGVGASATE